MLGSITNKKRNLESIQIDSTRSVLMYINSIPSILLYCIEKCQLSLFSSLFYNRFFCRPVRRPAGRVITL